MYDGLSTALGYASILAWLGAQMPQVYENYKNQSVEGLALPFLTSWMVGDATNLIGCILTHQLPFQTYLATYFVFVDLCLLSQYAYYSRRSSSYARLAGSPASLPTPRLGHAHGETPRQSYIRAARSETWISSSTAPGAHHHHSHSHSHSHSSHRDGQPRHAKRSSKSSHRTGSRARQTSARSGDESDPMSASWLSEASSTQSPPSALRRARKVSASVAGQERSSPTASQPTSPILPQPQQPSEQRGRSMHRPLPPPTRRQQALNYSSVPFGDLETISGSPSTSTSFHAPALQVAFDPTAHILPAQGGLEQVQQAEEEEREGWGHYQRGNSSSSRSRPPPMARRSSSMVFLSLGLLISFSRWTGPGAAETGAPPARAWSADISTLEQIPPHSASLRLWEGLQHPAFFGWSTGTTALPSHPHSLRRRDTFPLELSTPTAAQQSPLDATYTAASAEGESDDEDEPWARHRNWERFLGRASAWLCTSLYLTSRLPQIWQNFRRRSVEGLAMMLFVMAFVGNSLYVLSILTNPLMRTSGFLLESTPYLLGSGGTLCFDITIVVQSWLYSPKRIARREFERRRLAIKSGLGAEEEEALLRHEAELDGDATPRRSRSRLRSAGVPNPNGSHPGSRASSLRPSRSRTSSAHKTKSSSKSSSRSRGSERHARPLAATELDDRSFDWGAVDVSVTGEGPSRERSVSRPVSVRMDSSAEPTIGEEGESAVTIRG